jgi:alkylation response protein AidB-like acyl-CoA dehydrogenase
LGLFAGIRKLQDLQKPTFIDTGHLRVWDKFNTQPHPGDRCQKITTFGKLLAKRQAIQNNIAQMGTEIQAARLMAYEAAWKFDQGMDIVKEAAMAKLFAEQVLTRVSEMALRIHGGIGYTRAYPIERHFRDARSYHFEEGTEEIQKLLISRYLLR